MNSSPGRALGAPSVIRQYDMATLDRSQMSACHVAPLAKGYVGGPLVSVPGLCAALVESGVETTLLCLDLPQEMSQGVRVRNFPRWEGPVLKELSISPSLRKEMGRWAAHVDILHSHGMWQMPTIYPAKAAAGARCRLVVSPRGSLSAEALGRSRLTKRVVWWLAQRRVFEDAACIHATSVAEAEDVRRAGLKRPIAVIPNGVEFAANGLSRDPDDRGKTRVVYLGRLDPIKGLETLLRAWSSVQEKAPTAELVIAGDGEPSYRGSLVELGRALGLRRVSYLGEVGGGAKETLLKEASLLALPSLSENFGMVVAEALAAGVPAVVSRGAPWEGLRERGCGWWVDHGVSAWAAALETAVGLPAQDLAAMGMRGREWMRADFSWQRVGKMMAVTYGWLLARADRPSWVRLD